MAGKGFVRDYGRYLLDVVAWVFTVGGTIIALLLANDHIWYSVLIFSAITLSCLLFAFSRHRMLYRALEVHEIERERFATEARTAMQRLQDAERKLNEAPLDILTKIQALMATSAYKTIADVLKRYAGIIARIRIFEEALKRPLNLRKFKKQGNVLYVIAKGAGEALRHLQEGDPFLLVKTAADGLRTDAATLIVSQPPNVKDEVAYFAITRYISDEMGRIEALAATDDIEGIKGYSVEAPFDTTRYATLDLARFAAAIDHLMADIEGRGGVT